MANFGEKVNQMVEKAADFVGDKAGELKVYASAQKAKAEVLIEKKETEAGINHLYQEFAKLHFDILQGCCPDVEEAKKRKKECAEEIKIGRNHLCALNQKLAEMAKPEEVVYCHKCGAKFCLSESYCSKCGAPLTKEE